MSAGADQDFWPVEDEVLDLWHGEFDTAVIAETLTNEGLLITEAEVSQIIAADQNRRYAERSVAQSRGASA